MNAAIGQANDASIFMVSEGWSGLALGSTDRLANQNQQAGEGIVGALCMSHRPARARDPLSRPTASFKQTHGDVHPPGRSAEPLTGPRLSTARAGPSGLGTDDVFQPGSFPSNLIGGSGMIG